MNCSTARLEKLETVAERLRQLDWCIGYELTPEQYIELDDIRTLAYSIRDDDEAICDFEMCDICERPVGLNKKLERVHEFLLIVDEQWRKLQNNGYVERVPELCELVDENLQAAIEESRVE